MADELFGSVQKMNDDGIKYGRRSFIVALGVAVAGVGGWRYYSTRPRKYPARRVSFVTPNKEFYKVSYNIFYEPKIEIGRWRLELVDLKGRNIRLMMDDIKRMPSRLVHYTFECIENPVGGASMGNAEWRVVSLKDLLAPVLPPQTEGLRILATGMDGYYSSIPIELATDDLSALAYEMNGVPIPVDHGFPARLLIPGRYGMKQPKWLKKIEITDRKVTGYWEERGWSDDAELKAMSRLDRADHIETVGQDILLGGVAFSGRHAVARIEVSVDGGKSWRAAELETKPEKNTWSLWRYLWSRPAPGQYQIVCRMIDERGQRQIEKDDTHYPSGATGLHRVTLTVV